jgi:hypothetical protein
LSWTATPTTTTAARSAKLWKYEEAQKSDHQACQVSKATKLLDRLFLAMLLRQWI